MAGIVKIAKLTLLDMIQSPMLYSGLADGLIQLPVSPLKIKGKTLPVPDDLDTFSASICYGQRLYLSRAEPNDFGLIIRMIAGYYYSLYTQKQWIENNLLSFVKLVITCKVIQIYPIAMHMISLMGELAEREKTLLHREPSKMELAAGIEKINVFSELNSLDFLRDAMKCTVPEVLLTPYNECLVRFMMAKELSDYQSRYFELQKAEHESRNK
jgi:hypothetical protein